MILTRRQKKAASKLFRNNGGAIWHRVGQGKTRIAYKWFAMIAKVKSVFLVVCRREAFVDWAEEAQKCGLPWTVVDFEKDLHSSANIKVWLVSHGMLSSLLPYILEYEHVIEAVVYDEGFLYKNPQTLHCKAANNLSVAIGKAAILSGSIMTAKNLEDVYGQLFAIDKQEKVSRTLTDFRSKFMVRYQIGSDNPNAVRFYGKRGAVKIVGRRIKPVVSTYFPSDEKRRIIEDIHPIDATSQQLALIQKLKEEYFISLKGKDLELRNAPSVITKCQQISDGWVKMHDEKSDEGQIIAPGEIITVPSGKLRYLVSKVCELLECGEKVVIWCAFKHSVDLILQSLQTLGIKVYGWYGGKKFDVAGWRRNGQVAVATEASGSSVNHFSNCAYAIYYSMDYSWRNLVQSKGRTNRYDSNHNRCYYYFFQTRGSLDGFVYRTALSSGDKEKELIATQVKKWLTT